MGVESKEIVLPEQEEGAVVPVDVVRLVAIVDAFDKFKSMVLKESDFWLDKRENKKRVKKSGWLKYALACNLNLEKVDEREVDKELPPGSGKWVTVFHFDYRAVSQTGRYAEGSGSASTDERAQSDKIIHDTRTLAQTRAMNRAISHLVGGGEISAEEAMDRKNVESTQLPPKKPEKKRATRKKKEKKDPAKPKQASFGEGSVTVETVKYTLHGAGIGEDMVGEPREEGDLIVVEAARDMLDEDHYKIFGALEPMGAEWKEVGHHGQWELPKKE